MSTTSAVQGIWNGVVRLAEIIVAAMLLASAAAALATIYAYFNA